MTLWDEPWARKDGRRGRLGDPLSVEPVKRVARMIKRHLDGIVTAVVSG